MKTLLSCILAVATCLLLPACTTESGSGAQVSKVKAGDAVTISVPTMECEENCGAAIKAGLAKVEGSGEVKVDIESKTITVHPTKDMNIEDLVQAIPANFKASFANLGDKVDSMKEDLKGDMKDLKNDAKDIIKDGKDPGSSLLNDAIKALENK